jgi:hypothetical protein
MANTSASGGYLTPDALRTPEGDVEFAETLQSIVRGITGLPGQLVRQRWQARAGAQPDIDENWCGVGVGSSDAEGPPAIIVPKDDTNVVISRRHYIVTVVASFYGSNAGQLADMLWNGLYLGQNREDMIDKGLNLVDIGRIVHLPDRPNNLWRNRYDVSFRLRRRVEYTYAIQRVKTVQGTIGTDKGPNRSISVEV